ncbi:glycosyltransferase [Citrobacter werkmanii]|uniref:glycosyltransferase n=1 Tax=Citrobacter werkmanii TaxID=67827 RepID=UPI002953D373|nr:glycosyltransferase [Citrobacter werkmanii]MDV7070321.1 glycosyltransferase [Citrobacter werkmanii]
MGDLMESFSVLMSLYYRENANFFEECLSSLHNQTVVANEIIIVLDGKITPELESVILKWQDLLPLVTVPLLENVGLGKALRIGVTYCSNRLVARMDTDDICLPTRFEKQLIQFKNNPQLVLIGSNVCEYSEDWNQKLSEKVVPCDYLSIRSYAKYRNPFNHMTVMFDKDKIIEAGSYCHHLFMEDYNLWLRCLSKDYYMLNLAENLVSVRTGISMLKRRRGIEYIKSELELFKLKNRLKYTPKTHGLVVLALRVFPRLMPVFILGKLYKKR